MALVRTTLVATNLQQNSGVDTPDPANSTQPDLQQAVTVALAKRLADILGGVGGLL